MMCGKAKEGLEQECTNCGSNSWVAEQPQKQDESPEFEFQTPTTAARNDRPVSMADPKPEYIPADSILSFPNITQASKYRISIDTAGMNARLDSHDVRLNWDSIQGLCFEQHEAGRLLLGYVQVVAADCTEIAWTDHKLTLQSDARYWQEGTFQVPSGQGMIPLLSINQGLLLTSIVIDRAGLVERADGIFVRPDTMEKAAEETAEPIHESPYDFLQKVGSSSKRLKQVLLLLAGFAAASWLWGVQFAVALFIYLMIHEYGHVAGMKLCGVRVHGVFVLPFMGAVAISEDEAPTYWKAFLIAYMGPVFGAVITLVAAVVLITSGAKIPILREVTFSWAAISIFNLLPLGVLDGGRIVTSISFSTHRIVGILASVGTVLLCLLVALAGGIWLLGIVALAAFGELVTGIKQNKLVQRLAKTGCDPKNIRKALLACWKRLGLLSSEASPVATKKANNAKLQITFLRPFLSGRFETPKMSVLQILGAIGLYFGLFVFFVIILAIAVGSGMETAVNHYNRGCDYYAQGKYDLAISEITRAIELNPKFAKAYNNRGIAYYHKGEYDKAWEDVNKARSLGYQVDTEFLKKLRKASGREKQTKEDNLHSGTQERLLSRCLSPAHLDVDIFNAPLPGFFVCGEEQVELVSTDSPPPVEDFDWLAFIVPGHNHFGAEGVSFIGGREGIAPPDFVTGGRYTIREFTAASSTRTIRGYTHPNGLPLASLLGRSVHFRLIYNRWADTVRPCSGSAE
jgi:Zn-dependent protease